MRQNFKSRRTHSVQKNRSEKDFLYTERAYGAHCKSFRSLIKYVVAISCFIFTLKPYFPANILNLPRGLSLLENDLLKTVDVGAMSTCHSDLLLVEAHWQTIPAVAL